MNRRGFLNLLGLSAGTMVLDPEKLLWVPGKKTIFVPPPAISERLLTLDEINFFTKKYIIPNVVDQVFAVPSSWLRHIERDTKRHGSQRVLGTYYTETSRED